ncbi:MAG: glycosyltransferase [Lachnospiraceae bacterium]
MKVKTVDIIIPIYNAYEELQKCISSIKKWTDLQTNRLVLVNDKSSDERIRPYLDRLKQENIIVIHNEKNQGFSANINIGMQQSASHDVILLNSDTIVTKNWIEKMQACAYSDPTIATATPVSNNATLCSVPDFCEENPLPEGYTVDEYAELIEKISQRIYPVIPVAHGFCMYVKREVIKKIGGFDAETFQKGYGEENDFCYRAIEAGYHHVMCDDTFILHTGTSSFVSEEKQKLIQDHERILDERYPTLMQNVRIHCRDNPNAVVSENVRFWIDFQKRKNRKTVLYQVQSDFREDADDHVGGTQLHVKDLVYGCRDEFDIVVVARNGFYLNVTLYTENKEFPLRYYIGKKPEYEMFRSKQLGILYGKILEQFHVELVHVHHTLGMSFEMFYQAQQRQIPIDVTLHDFYYICPSVKLLNQKDQLCIGQESKEMCQICMKEQKNIASTVPYIEIWRKESQRILQMAEHIFTPSESAKKIYLRYFQNLEDKIEVVTHGMEYEPHSKEKKKERKSKTFRVAFVGGINVAKGYQYATELIKKSNDKDIEWYLFGMFQQTEASVEKKKNFKNIGAYQREELTGLLQNYQIDLICILPIWPETFCYTITEAVLAGIPVLTTEIGALPERLEELKCGWSVPNGSTVTEILDKIREIKEDPTAYQKTVDHIRGLKPKTAKEMCETYKKRYCAQLQETNEKIQEIDFKWFTEGMMTVLGRMNLPDAGGGSVLKRAEEAERQLEVISQSTTYRIVLALAHIKIPFREQLGAGVRKIYRIVRKRK